MRTTREELDGLARIINATLASAGTVFESVPQDFFIEYSYGQPRLVRAGGSVDISPRLTTGQMKDWLQAFHLGIVVGMHHKESK